MSANFIFFTILQTTTGTLSERSLFTQGIQIDLFCSPKEVNHLCYSNAKSRPYWE